MKTVKLTCQNCGAALDVKDNVAFCSYCGAKLLLDDENRTITHNYNYTHTKRDEARIREAEQKEAVRLKELENKENQKIREHKQQKWILIGWAIAIVVAFAILGIMALVENLETQSNVQMPCAVSEYRGENYEEVVRELEDLGFSNIEISAKKDLVTGWLTKDGSVEKVSINGDTDFEEDDIFPKNAKVVVTYHTFED